MLVFIVFIFGIALIGVIGNDNELNEYERRELAQFPKVSLDRVTEGRFTEDYVEYLQDQAPFRDGFRFLKSSVSRQLLLNPEINGVFVLDGTVYDRFYPIDVKLIDRAARLIGDISAEIDSDRQYVAVIPTKGQDLVGTRYLVSDQLQIIRAFDRLTDVQAIDLYGLTGLVHDDGYYRSDPHWAKNGVNWSYEQIATALGLEPVPDFEYELFTDSYIGSDYGKAASSSIASDNIYLPRNKTIDNLISCRYTSLEDKSCIDSVFYRGEESENDAYDVFLGGLGPIIEITNPGSDSSEELVIFKDSYAHALSPLLAQHYHKVTMFDLRFVRRNMVIDNFDLDSSTVLFLYSTSVLNTDAQILN